MPPLRLLPDRPLPPYSYVPGQSPHPTSDPAGHSFGAEATCPAPPESHAWRQCREFLWGIDLFNAGYFWEAHEAWEGLWLACGRRGPVATLLKGLIKLAAAGVKLREGREEGFHRHAARAAELFAEARGADGPRRRLGLDVAELQQRAERLSRQQPTPRDPAALGYLMPADDPGPS